MTKIKENDFIEVEFDIFANGKLVQTTDKEKSNQVKSESKDFGPQTIIVGKAFVLKALDEDILKECNFGEEKTLNLEAKQAYGLRDKTLIQLFPKSAFDEKKIRAIPGMLYDFNGMFGTVKSVVGGRVMVDFNNPLAGKEIKLSYRVVKKIEALEEKISFVFEKIIKLPKNNFKVSVKDKVINLTLPKELSNTQILIKGLEEFLGSLKDYDVKIETFKK